MKYFLLVFTVFSLAISVSGQAQELSVKYCENLKRDEEARFKDNKAQELKSFDERVKNIDADVEKLNRDRIAETEKMNQVISAIQKRFGDKFKQFEKETNLLTQKEFNSQVGANVFKSIFNGEFERDIKGFLEDSTGGVYGRAPCYNRVTTKGAAQSKICIHAFKGKVFVSSSTSASLPIGHGAPAPAPAPMSSSGLEFPELSPIQDDLYSSSYWSNGPSSQIVDRPADIDEYKKLIKDLRIEIADRWNGKKADIGKGCESLLKRKSKNISVEEQEAEDAKANGAQRTE